MHVHLKPIDVALARAHADAATLRLTERCPQCRAAAVQVDEWTTLADHSDPLVAAEIEMGRIRLETLRSLPLSQALELIRTDPEYHRWGLTRLVLLAAREYGCREASAEETWSAFELVLFGLELVPRLDPELYGGVSCLRIGLQLLETGLQVVTSILDAEDLDRARERVFRRIYALLETFETLE